MSRQQKQGDHQVVYASNLVIIGNFCKVYGDGNWVIGNDCLVQANKCRVCGDRNEVKGDDNVIDGNDNKYSGDRVIIQGGKRNQRIERSSRVLDASASLTGSVTHRALPSSELARRTTHLSIRGVRYDFIFSEQGFFWEIFEEGQEVLLAKLEAGNMTKVGEVDVSFDSNGKLEVHDPESPVIIEKPRTSFSSSSSSSTPPHPRPPRFVPAPSPSTQGPQKAFLGKVPPPIPGGEPLAYNLPLEQFCVECKTREKRTRLEPCGHSTWCVTCVRSLFLKAEESSDFKCPTCDAEITRAIMTRF